MPDELDRRILQELTKDARTSLRTIAKRLGVSTPTISDRVRRLEDTGFIVGYRVVTVADPSPEEPSRKEWQCFHCGGPIRGDAVVRTIADTYRPFCCAVCADLQAEKYERLRRGAARAG